MTDLKNNIWKNSDADWIIVCDIDELLQITENNIQLLPVDVNVISTKGYNMIDLNDEKLLLEELVYGVYAPPYSKKIMFKNKHILEINYQIGAHLANPFPNPVYSIEEFNLLHYNKGMFTLDSMCEKFKYGKTKLNEHLINKSLDVLWNSNKTLSIKVL